MTVQELIDKLEQVEDKQRTIVTTEYDSEYGTLYVRTPSIISSYYGYYEIHGEIIKVIDVLDKEFAGELKDKNGNVTYY